MDRSMLFVLAAAGAAALSGCGESRPDYAGRKLMPYTQQFEIKGSPKRIVTTEYFAEDYPSGKYSWRQELNLTPEGYVAGGVTENEANRQVFEYAYSPGPCVQYAEVKNTVYYHIGGKDENVTQYMVDDKGNFTKGIEIVNGKPTYEHAYVVDEQGYPVEHTVYRYGQSGDNFEKKEVNEFKGGRKVETKVYHDGGKQPRMAEKVIDDGEHQLYKIGEVTEYGADGKPTRYVRYNYDDAMRPIVDESSDDGKTWTVDREYVYDAQGNMTERTLHMRSGDRNYKYAYEYDSHGNWTKRDDGAMVTIREIEYY